MSRDPKPWFRSDRDAWFVTINGRRFNLGPDRDVAHKRFHELMLNGGDEHADGTISLFSLFDEFLEWTSGYGTSVKCTPDANGPAVLRIPNIRNRELDFTDLKFATKSEQFKEEDYVTPGDFLLIRTNGSIDLIGRAAVVQSTLPTKCSFASYLIRFRLLGDRTLWAWISFAWDSLTVRSAIQRRATTTAGQYNVSLSGLSTLAIPLPPRKEQVAIIHEVQSRLAAADELAATLERQLGSAQRTRQSLLDEAFAGKLVTQESKDESAVALLERIRLHREADSKKPKVKRMPKTKLNFATWKLVDVIEDKFGNKAFTFDALRKETRSLDYDDLRNDLYELLRPGTSGAAPVLRMSFDAKRNAMEFKLQRQ